MGFYTIRVKLTRSIVHPSTNRCISPWEKSGGLMHEYAVEDISLEARDAHANVVPIFHRFNVFCPIGLQVSRYQQKLSDEIAEVNSEFSSNLSNRRKCSC